MGGASVLVRGKRGGRGPGRHNTVCGVPCPKCGTPMALVDVHAFASHRLCRACRRESYTPATGKWLAGAELDTARDTVKAESLKAQVDWPAPEAARPATPVWPARAENLTWFLVHWWSADKSALLLSAGRDEGEVQ